MVIFLLMSFVFTVIIFLWTTFFTASPTHLEEQYIEQSVYDDTHEHTKIDYIQLAEDVLKEKWMQENEASDTPSAQESLGSTHGWHEHSNEENQEDVLSAAREINFWFVPLSYREQQIENREWISTALKKGIMKRFISKISVVLYENKVDVRWKMKNKTVKLFGPHIMDDDELYGVFFHELAHYIDLYYFKRNRFSDISNRFYDLSWYSTIVMLPGQEQKHFVSGYAMSNKYEDFAESLAYYMLHNEDFRVKAGQSEVLQKKYDFFDNWLFKKGQFIDTDFSQGNEVLDYYRDITKIDFSKENFLQYLEKNI